MSNNMRFAITAWQGARVRKHDVLVAKNYLNADEIDTLNRLVVIFLEQAELRVKQRNDLTLDFWQKHIDRLLEFSDQAVLKDAGTVSHEAMKRVAHERYEAFDRQRRHNEAMAADADDLSALEALERQLKEDC